MNTKLVRRIKKVGIVTSPAFVGALMVLSMLSGTVGGSTYIVGWSSDTQALNGAQRIDNVIAGAGPPGIYDRIAVIGVNLWTDTADTFTSIDVSLTDTAPIGEFDANVDILQVQLYYDNPASVNGVWEDGVDALVATGGAFVGASPTWTTTINAGGAYIPYDDSWENQGFDFFIVVETSGGITDGDIFQASVPAFGITTSSGALAGSFTGTQVTCDYLNPDLLLGATDILSVSSDIPGDPYLDDEDTYNEQLALPIEWVGDDVVFYNDYPGEGSDQVTTITIQNFIEVNPYAFYGQTTYFNEDPVDYSPSAGAFSIDYKLTWTESDTTPGINGINMWNTLNLIVEDDVAWTSQYVAPGNFYFIQDDDPPMSMVNLNNGGTGLWYYDESLSGNYLPYTDENNDIWIQSIDSWWTAGSGFDRGTSYAEFRVGVERSGVETFWSPGWMTCDIDSIPAGVTLNIPTDIVADGNIGGGPYGYYFVEFRVQDDVGNNIRVGDGNFEIFDLTSGNYLDSDRIYFKIAQDYSWYYGSGDTTNGYTVAGTQTFTQAALSVSDLNIPGGTTLNLYDTEVFLDSSINGERHVDVQGTLITDSISNSAGYDVRSAFTHRGLSSFSGGPSDFPYTFWVRDNAVLTMNGTVVEGCGFNIGDPTLDDIGIYILTNLANANIMYSELRFNGVGVVTQDNGGVTISNSEIWNNFAGVWGHDSPNLIDVSDCDIHDNIFGILLERSRGLIDHNDIYDNVYGVYMTNDFPIIDTNSPGGTIVRGDITNNHIHDNTAVGIYMENSYYLPEGPHGGTYAFNSGRGNFLDKNLTYTFDLTSLNPGDKATLTFWQWYNFGGDSNDGGNVLYYNDTWARWLPLRPEGSYDLANTPGYTHGAVAGLDGDPGFAAYNELTYWTVDGWSQVEYDLSQFSGQSVTLRFRHGTDSANYGTGWFIDDLAIPETGWTSGAESGTGWTLNGWGVTNVASFSTRESLIQGNNISQNSQQGIYVMYSDVNILDNTIWDNDWEGIMFEYFVDALIDSNIVDENFEDNLYATDWMELTITNNDFTRSDNGDGIDIENFCNALIDGNTITWNDGEGIYAYYFCDLTITDNEISYNGGYGMDLEGYGTYYYVENNDVNYNGYGIYAYEAYGLIESPYAGNSFYWVQGQYAQSNEYLTYDFDLTMAPSTATLTFQNAYSTEPWCDGGFVEYWNASSGMWEMLYPREGYITPSINGDGMGPNAGQYYGYEGYSMGWRTATFDLDMLTGGWARIRFHYATDVSQTYGGWAIDNIEIAAIGFFDGAESAAPPSSATYWQVMNHGFLRSDGRWNYILNNIFNNNDDDALYLEETFVDVEYNIITFNDGYGIYIYDYCYAYVDSNEITFQDDYGIYIEEYCYVELTNNNISYNYYGIYIYDYCQVIIDNNIIEYTYDETDDAVISVEDYCYVEITNNYIAYNNKDFWFYAIELYDTENSFIIRDNTIIENGYGIYLEDTYVTPPPSGTYAWHTQNSVYRSTMSLSRSFNLGSLAPGDEATLTFWHWYDIGSSAGGCIQVYNETSNTWETINPIDYHGYDSTNIDRLFDSPGYGDSDNSWNYEWDVFYETYSTYWQWDGCDDGWIFAEFDLSPWAGDTDVLVRWLYTEYDSIYAGWFIDDIAIPEIGFLADVEDLLLDNSGWTADGWARHYPAGIIEDNDISNNLGYGIEMNSESYPDIINNDIIGNGYNGIYISSQFGDQYEYIRPAAPSGTHMWYSGYANYADFYLYQQFDLTSYSDVTLTFYHWYYTEDDYDGGVVEVYENGQWLKVEPRGTYPNEFYYGGEGYSSDDEYEWQYAHFDLSDYAGKSIVLRFRFMTDDSSEYTGWYIDDITLTGDGTTILYDNVESGNNGWTVDGSNIVDNRYGPPKGWSIMETNAMIIQGNDISYNGYESYAGIYFDDYVNAILDDNDINHNGQEGSWGPGLYAYEDSTLSVRNNRIRYNAYGGVYAEEYVYGVWQNNIITHNYGTEDDYESGHGVYFYDYCSGIFVNNYIADNQHAGMYLEYGDYVIMNNVITNNHWQGIHLYEVGYDEWNHPTYLEDNILTNNYMFDRLEYYLDDEWSGCGLFVESSSYVHVFNGEYSNNERYGIFVTDSVSEFQWIIDGEAEVENNAVRIHGGDYYVEDEFGGGEIYPVLVADGGMLTLKNVRDFQTWLYSDTEYYGIEVEAGGMLDARGTTFDSWYYDNINNGDYYVPDYVWSFVLPYPVLDDDYYEYGQFDDHTISFVWGPGTIFQTEIPWDQLWTDLSGGEYKVNYRTGEVVLSPWTSEGTGSWGMSYNYYYKEPIPYIFRVFGSLYMDDCKVVNTTSLYLETPSPVDIFSTEFTWNLHGGISSVNSNPTIQDCWFHDIDFGVFAEDGTLIIDNGNMFNYCVDGIHLSDGATASVADNMFYENMRAITVYDSPNVDITGNEIYDSYDDGLHIVDSMATISENTISGSMDKAVYLRSSTATMNDNLLMDNYFSVYASDSILDMTSDYIAGTTLEDIYSEDNSEVTALDITFDRDEMLAVVDNSWVEIQWFTYVEVLDMTGNPYRTNASLSEYVSVSSSLPPSQQTDVNGYTPVFITTEYIQYSSTQDNFKTHTITAVGNVSGIFYTTILNVDIIESDTHTLILNLGPTLETAPGLTITFAEDTIEYSAANLNLLFEDDGGDDQLTYSWSGNINVIITTNADDVIDLSATANWDGTEVVQFMATDMWGETITYNITIEVTPVNDPPSATDVTLLPYNPEDMDDLTGDYTYLDPVEADLEDEAMTLSTFAWYRSTDGGISWSIVEEFNGVDTVPYTATHWGEMWKFSVRPVDLPGDIGDEYESNSVMIVRIIPNIYFDDVEILGEPSETDELTANLVNPQGDTSQTMYQWYRNGWLIDGATLDTLTPDYYDEGDTITVEATPFDGYNSGDPVMSSEGVVIMNSPPSLEGVIIMPQHPHLADDLIAIPMGYSDPDVGDYTSYMNNTNYFHLYFIYTWNVSGSIITGVTGDTLESSYITVDDNVTVTVTPSDGELFGTPITSQPVRISVIPFNDDYDADWIPNDEDYDDDDDGHPDVNDAFPFDASEWRDSDGDGKGDNADHDDDNDGFPDGFDFAPRDKNVQWGPYPWLILLFLILVLLVVGYLKWWRAPKEPTGGESVSDDYYSSDSDTFAEEELGSEDLEGKKKSDEELRPGSDEDDFAAIAGDKKTEDKEVPEPPKE